MSFMKTKKEIRFFSPDMKMSDLVEINYRLLTVLSRLGMPAGFGEKTVAQVCTMAGIDTGAFILICEMYSYQGYMPTDEALKAADPLSVLRYLHISHSFYIEDGFKALEQLMNALVAPCAENQKKIILEFLEGYRNEVEKHFKGKFHAQLSRLATGVFSDFAMLSIKKGDSKLLKESIDKYPVFGREFMSRLTEHLANQR